MKKHPKIELPDPPKTAGPEVSQHALQQMREVQAELASRRLESLRLYRPMPHQEEFHKCMASERIVLGGNRGGKSLAVAVTGPTSGLSSIRSSSKPGRSESSAMKRRESGAPCARGTTSLKANQPRH
jgi:hypothetical protein